MAGQTPGTEQFEAYFQRADVDRDGRVSGNEAVAFLQASNLPRQVLAQIWMYADQNHVGFLGRSEFYNCLKLVTVAQSKKELTPDLVKAALYGPASARIPPPQINPAATIGPQSNSKTVPSPVQLAGTSTSTQGIGQSAHHGFLTQQSQITGPSRPLPPSSGFDSQPGIPAQRMPSIGSMSVSPRPSNSFNSLGGVTDAAQAKLYSHVPNRSSIPSATQGDISLITSPITQLKAPESTGFLQSALSKPNDTSLVSSQFGKADFKSHSATGNGFGSGSVSGDVISTTSSEAQNIPAAVTYPGNNITAPSTGNLTSSRQQPTVNPSAVSQPPSVQAHQLQSTGRANQQILTQKSSAYPVAPGQSQSPWPKMTQSDLQKYRKVFVQVDTDRDGKITGEQARNLFLSWRLPREVLKQVWDLSDQDNDSMLSLREFCIALYLMERHREGSPLPKVLPSAAMFDDTLLPASGPPAAVHGNASWRPSGFQELQGAKNARSITPGGVGKPPHPVPVPQPDEPIQRQAKVPILEKHLLNQLSTGEQESLNRKFEEAKDAEKKVSDLEKDISEAKQKIQFYHSKMQELILYKSRCDNRLNEISEKVIGDKKEAESLANKYEEKYKRTGDVASKLSIEEATFRDIQAQKMELYRAIAKLEQDNADGVQDRANKIQIDLDELVKTLNEQCKTYGLRGKPTSLVELPFGWQIGIEAATADWDEVWDKFEDEGFTYVKEHTLEVENVIAPLKQKSALIRVHASSLNTSKADNTSDLPNSEERVHENESLTHKPEQTTSPPESPVGNMNGSPHAFDTQSEYGAESVLSGGRRFDETDWGSFDTHYDTVAAWDLPKEAEFERHSEASSFGPDDWGLNPIRTGVTNQGPFFDSVPSTPNQGPFFDSVPSTPKQGPFFDSVPSTPQYNFGDNNLFTTNSAFADSVPSTPMYSSNTSPRRVTEGSEDQFSLNSFSRFDSFNMNDSGPFGGTESFTRFDSMKSTRDSADFDQGFGSLARFDSFRSTADSDYNFGGVFPTSDSFSRNDSMHSTRDSDYGQGFQSFDDGADPFGSSEPFRTSHETKTPEESDNWRTF